MNVILRIIIGVGVAVLLDLEIWLACFGVAFFWALLKPPHTVSVAPWIALPAVLGSFASFIVGVVVAMAVSGRSLEE